MYYEAKIKNQNYNDQVKQEGKDNNSVTKPHSKQGECKKKDLISSKDCLHPSKHVAFLSLQIHHIKQCGTSLQKSILRCCLKLICQDSNNSITFCGITQWSPNKHNTKDHISKVMGVIKQKMIHRFLTSLTHVTPIKNNNVPFANVISCKNLTKRSWPWKESHPWRNLRLPYQPPREIKSRRVERKIKNANLKTSTPCWLPTKLIKANPPHFQRVNSVHKPFKRFFLPILGWTKKMKIPMNPPTRPTHNLTKESLAPLRQ